MENKYYVPSIEEFHVGFEYEAKPNDPLGWGKVLVKTFPETPHNLGGRFLFEFIEDRLSINCIRVKYLDKEDIESLGYSLSKEDDSYKEFLKVGEFYKYYIVICPIFSKNLGVYVNIFTDQNTDQTIRFSGFIKNKAELTKLLKQLDIL